MTTGEIKRSERPILAAVPLVCLVCRHEWEQSLIYNVAVSVWIAHVESLHCPSCGANYHGLAFRTASTPVAPGAAE